MTRVYCTKKLKEFIGNIEETLPDDYIDIKTSDWNAHLFFVDKRKCIVFVNILTYYSVFVADFAKKDLKNIDEIFGKRLKEQLSHDKVVVDFENARFLTEGSKISFIKTNNNKTVIGRINDFVDMFKIHCTYKYGHLNEMDIVYENGLFNMISTGKYGDIKKSWTNPFENVKEKIKTNT
ncbi:MAG: hypothetical protein HOO86_04045 [Bacteroidales bacterium]|nr:hypothetical protein [Bacteroidales bacterium]